jgi:sialic acid synthase SpsE
MYKYLQHFKQVFIIAEIGVNHNGSITIAKKLVDKAKEAGADAVKFQSYTTENLASPITPKVKYQLNNTNKNESHFKMLKNLELNFKEMHQLSKYCKDKSIEFISTPYDVENAKFLKRIGMKIFKTASADLNDSFLHEYLSSIKKTIIISTGMSGLDEIKLCLKKYNNKENIILLHCVSCYPAPLKILNLNNIQTLKNVFNLRIGFSDHSKGSRAATIAVAKGANVIEKHFTLNKNMRGPDHKTSLNFKEFKQYVKEIRNTEEILGSYKKECLKEEKHMKYVSTKSLAVAKNLKIGEKITLKKLKLLRPNKGISSLYLKKILGKKINKSKKLNDHLYLKDVK